MYVNLSIPLIFSLTILTFMNIIVIVHYNHLRSVMYESNKRAEKRHDELVMKLIDLQSDIDLICSICRYSRSSIDDIYDTMGKVLKNDIEISEMLLQQSQQIKEINHLSTKINNKDVKK